jgi:hypothetical protein
MGEEPMTPFCSTRFREGINLPEIDVFTTKSGAMTQEIFYNFSNDKANQSIGVKDVVTNLMG